MGTKEEVISVESESGDEEGESMMMMKEEEEEEIISWQSLEPTLQHQNGKVASAIWIGNGVGVSGYHCGRDLVLAVFFLPLPSVMGRGGPEKGLEELRALQGQRQPRRSWRSQQELQSRRQRQKIQTRSMSR